MTFNTTSPTQWICCVLALFFLPIPIGSADEAPAPVRRTGQTATYGSRDDGALEKGVAWPVPRFTDQGNGTVKDNLTDLIWMKNANCWGSQTWENAFSKMDGLNSGSQYCSGYTTGTHTDWRLPNIRELKSLIDKSHVNPALPSSHPFSGVQSYNYWSATTIAGYTDDAWYVYLNYGYVDGGSKAGSGYVWPVRGGQ